MSDETKLKKADVEKLYGELIELEAWIDPKPDPAQWPPAGWAYHPTAPGMLYRCISEADLREEIFGSPEKTSWLEWAKQRVSEIKDALIPYFFSKPKEEGTERKTKCGFVVMLKNELDRKLDLPALALTVAECQRIATEEEGLSMNVENTVLKYTPELKLKEYRDLPASVRKQFDQALIVTPKKPKFEIVRENV
jgi:hypothetical protein